MCLGTRPQHGYYPIIVYACRKCNNFNDLARKKALMYHTEMCCTRSQVLLGYLMPRKCAFWGG